MVHENLIEPNKIQPLLSFRRQQKEEEWKRAGEQKEKHTSSTASHTPWCLQTTTSCQGKQEYVDVSVS